MELHYNAFISYRHHPDDIRVASEIHRSLERFKVPASIRKKTGKIDRLFRDKDELPITSNLTDDIGSALRNSDYLIVICSVHTRESLWVQREIELFLQTHHRSKVLTVLASGEPYDVIPEILLYEDVTDPVTGEITRQPIEPLSCDWRMKRSKAVRDELPRLAAALLGCAYDELRQRQKQYRTRRLITFLSTAMAASVCLAAYFLYTSITIRNANVRIQQANEEIQAANVQIQANLEEALRNQSRHLATAARERLENGDRLTALSLAIAALPGEGNERPYVPEAERVLIDSLGIYNTVNHLAAVGVASPGVNVGIADFMVTETESVLYIRDKRRVITAWDTATLQPMGSVELGNLYFSDMSTVGDNLLVLVDDDGFVLRCYRPDGTLVWQQEKCVDYSEVTNKGTLLIIQRTSDNGYQLLQLNPATGEPVEEALLLPLPETGQTPSSFCSNTLAEGLPLILRYFDYGKSDMYALDLQTGEIRLQESENGYATRSLVTLDGKLLMIGGAEGLGIGGRYEDNRVTNPETRTLYCYDVYTGQLLWSNRISTSLTGTVTLAELPETDDILCQVGNAFALFNRETGQLISRCEAGNTIEAVSVAKDCVTAVLQDGYICYFWYKSNYCYEVKTMGNGVFTAAVGENAYVMYLEGDQVVVYHPVVPEPLWTGELGITTSSATRRVSDPYLALQYWDMMCLVNTATGELLWGTQQSGCELLGFSSDSKKMWLTYASAAIAVDTATGQLLEDIIVLEEGEATCGDALLRQDHLYYMVNDGKQLKLKDLDLTAGTFRTVVIRDVESSFWMGQVLEQAGDYVWLWDNEEQLLEVNLATGENRCVVSQTSCRPSIAANADASWVAIANQSRISLGKPGQRATFQIPLETGIEAGSLYFRGQELLALCTNGFVYRYDGAGRELSQIDLQVDATFVDHLLGSSSDPEGITWQFTEDNRLILGARNQGSIIDCNTWGRCGTVDYFLMYSSQTREMICSLSNGIAGFPVYGTQQLLELARQELNGYELTQEQLASFGIDG